MNPRLVCRLQFLSRMAHCRPLPLLYNSYLRHSALYTRKINPSLHLLHGCSASTDVSKVPVTRKRESCERPMYNTPKRNEISNSFFRNGLMFHKDYLKVHHKIHDYPWVLEIPDKGRVQYKENWYRFKSERNDLAHKINNLMSESDGKTEYDSIQIAVDLYHYFFQKCTELKCERSFLLLKNIEQSLCSSLHECCNDQRIVNVSMLKDIFEILEVSAAKGLPCQDLYNVVLLNLNEWYIWSKVGRKEVLRALSIHMIYEKSCIKLKTEMLKDCLHHHHELSIAEVGLLIFSIANNLTQIGRFPSLESSELFTDLLEKMCSEKFSFCSFVLSDCLRLFEISTHGYICIVPHKSNLGAIMELFQHINGTPKLFYQMLHNRRTVQNVFSAMEKAMMLHVPFTKSFTDNVSQAFLMHYHSCYIIKKLGMLQFDVNNTRMYNDMLHLSMINKEYIEKLPLTKKLNFYVNLMIGFAYVDIFSLSLWDSMSDILRMFDEKSLKDLHDYISVLGVVKEIEYQNESQKGLPAHIERVQQTWIDRSRKKQTGVHFDFIDAVKKELKVELGNHCVHCHHILPGFLYPDIELRLDENDKPLTFDPVNYSEILRDNYWHENPAHKKLVIMCIKYPHHTVVECYNDISTINFEDAKLNGHYNLKKSLLQRLGYTVHVLKKELGDQNEAEFM